MEKINFWEKKKTSDSIENGKLTMLKREQGWSLIYYV